MALVDSHRRLEDAVFRGRHASALPIDEESPAAIELSTGGPITYADVHNQLDLAEVTYMRSRLRYLAALFPNQTKSELAATIHGIVGNSSLTVGDVRLILDGRSLHDPSRRTRELPIEVVQAIGACLMKGMSRSATSRVVNASSDSVETIDRYLGISETIRQKHIEKACDAIRDGVSIRAFAQQEHLTRTTAHRIMKQARSVLVELDEVAA